MCARARDMLLRSVDKNGVHLIHVYANESYAFNLWPFIFKSPAKRLHLWIIIDRIHSSVCQRSARKIVILIWLVSGRIYTPKRFNSLQFITAFFFSSRFSTWFAALQ